MNAHNLRAPVATLLGLIQLFESHQIEESERKEIVKKIKLCTVNLDKVIKEIMVVLE